MRTRAVLGSIFASTAVLIVGWEAGETLLASSAATTAQLESTSNAATSTPSDTTAPDAAASPTTTATETPVAPAAGAADGIYTGASVNTRFGSVQVSVTISNGAISEVTALKLTDDEGKSVQISNRAAPILREEVLAAQSAQVSNVSGATYTSDAYLESVQSALDQAGF